MLGRKKNFQKSTQTLSARKNAQDLDWETEHSVVEHDLIAGEPAQPDRVGAYLEPFVILVEDFQFRPVVNGEGFLGLNEPTCADDGVGFYDDGDASRAGLPEGRSQAGSQ